MKIIINPDQLSNFSRGSCVTWGNFDGVHLGHQKLLKRVVSKARENNLEAVIITFAPHPLHVLGVPLPIITCMQTRLELIADLGLDMALVMPFTKKLARLESEDFVRKVLAGSLNTRQMVMGYSSFFGKDRRGSATLLADMGRELNFKVEQLPPVLLDGAVVSSTRIRKLINEGAVHSIPPLLGRNHFVEGHVIKGKGLGRQLGFPTLNIQAGTLESDGFDSYKGLPLDLSNPSLGVCSGMLPHSGVYAAYTEYAGKLFPSVASVGASPTFEQNYASLNTVLEVHLFNFNQELYGQNVRVQFKNFLRPMLKFEITEQLIFQIKLDVEKAKKML